MHRTGTVVIGGGQAGLATSAELSAAGDDHVVLERGRTAERWQSARWDSLRLLTPNWMSRLPSHQYGGPDPDGYMTTAEVTAYLRGYAALVCAPVVEHAPVHRVLPGGRGYVVESGAGTWTAERVVVATGAADVPNRPSVPRGLRSDLVEVDAAAYRNPAQLPDGAVLVVGASASGVQIADELRAAGREVVLSAGRHTRLPRTYRGRDVLAWLEAAGVLDQTVDDVPDVDAARRQPSLQLIGRPDRRTCDLATVAAAGVVVTGRLLAIDGLRAHFAADLPRTTASAQAWMHRQLDVVDRHIAVSGADAGDPDRPPTVQLPPGVGVLDLRLAGLRTVVWATGYGRRYPWLHVPVIGTDGDIAQRRGVTPSPGLYVVGMRFQHRRSSAFLDGVRHDARDVVGHMTSVRRRRIA